MLTISSPASSVPTSTGKYTPPHKRSAQGGLTTPPRSSSPPQRADSSWRSPAKQSEGKWRSCATPSSSPPKQTIWRSKSASPRSSRPNGLTPAEARVGTIAFLPVIPKASESVLHAQLFNSGHKETFFNHPVLIVGALSNTGTVKILPLTSFGDRTVSEKWNRAANKGEAVKWYVPVEHASTERLGQIPILSTEGAVRLLKQSYVNIREEFEVEISYLGKKFETIVLNENALRQLAAFRNVVASGVPIVV